MSCFRRRHPPPRLLAVCAACLLSIGLAPPAPSSAQSELDRLDEMRAKRHAKRVCSEFFLAGREPAEVLEQDHDSNDTTVSIRIRRRQRTVEATTIIGSVGEAIYRPGLGCTLLHGVDPDALTEQGVGAPVASQLDAAQPWPRGAAPATSRGAEVDAAALDQALLDAFVETSSRRERGTRAVAVVWDGQPVAERYAPGFRSDQPMLTWSINKSILNALLGVLAQQGRLDVEAPVGTPEWAAGDPRARITIDEMLHMTAGLEFEEVYETALVDVVEMLFTSRDMAAFAAAKQLEHPPGTRWKYSSGTTNILARMMRRAIGGPLSDYTYFPRRELFEKLGMSHTTLELDTVGTFAASSFGYSTARDLARLGQLFLQDGVWEGERLLPEGWVAYTTAPTPLAPQRSYGAHFWLNAGNPDNPRDRLWPSVPTDAFGMSGFEGQSVVIVPSRKAVVVRLGRTLRPEAWDLDRFLASVLAALPQPPAPPPRPPIEPADGASAPTDPASDPEPPPETEGAEQPPDAPSLASGAAAGGGEE
ncbi:MAG: class C beta-lactamase-related serine hydrolase [Acidobacteria bacterium]|nr:MAG: class C beta-lactamase-related serine hydrolase [Acidobacteriota bacterium]